MPPDAPGMSRNIVSVELANADIPALTADETATLLAGLEAGLLFDAPADGSFYLRQDQEWVTLPPYPDVPVLEAPIDTTPYVRQDAAWLPLPVPSHNATGDLNTGDFRHLTAAEYTNLQQATNPLGTLTTGDTVTLDIAEYGATTATVPDTATITLAATGWRGAGYWDSHALILTLEGAATVQIPVDWIPQGATLTFATAGTVTLVVYSPDGTNIYYAGAN